MAAVCDVAIVGGGYAGTVLALHLIRTLRAGHIVLVEPRDHLGEELTYSVADATYCINVPARTLDLPVPSGRPRLRGGVKLAALERKLLVRLLLGGQRENVGAYGA